MTPSKIAERRGRLGADKHRYRLGQVLILAPSRGLGGGIERYMETLEWAFAVQEVPCQRLDLRGSGVRAHLAMLANARAFLRLSSKPTRLIVGHRALMPTATLLARESTACGISVVCHGIEGWGSRLRPRRAVERYLMGRPGVRVVAVSSFTAGTLARDCRSTILPPGLSQEWFDTLINAAPAVQERVPGTHLATAFRLASWQEKGLRQLVEAITVLGRDDIDLTICGGGDPPPDLLRFVADHKVCTLRASMTDRELAHQLARADLFVLATRTRPGRGASGEGFGLVLLEAQVAGTPVVAPAHGGSSDAYLGGITGAAPADETPEALTSVLNEILEDPARLVRMGRRAGEWSRESFAPERYARMVVRKLI